MPVRPVEPPLEGCCGTGCTPCVFDRYEADLARYEAAIKAIKAMRERAGDSAAAAGPTAAA
ncbi:MAG: oxidoreductase-like domain-containing protein [Burkholderiaceae bacterium]|jgi:hypothetical protein|nr:oxidoreductase-like domain-containing protein [Burkholderiaceae bacterium]